jgi:hypothetical protein
MRRLGQHLPDLSRLARVEVSRPLAFSLSSLIICRSETAPTEGTLKVFPDILLSNASVRIRALFRQPLTFHMQIYHSPPFLHLHCLT